jgi:lysophospholipase L1-like esterase
MLFQQLVGVAFIGQAIAKAVDLHRLYTREEFGVNRYAALGDSFAAGPGAGKTYDESWCHRSEGAWPRLVAADTKIRKDKDTIDKFEFNACTGALSKHVYRESQKEEHGPNSAYPQTDRIVGLDPQLVTLSIGGNDVGFVELLDQVSRRDPHQNP